MGISLFFLSFFNWRTKKNLLDILISFHPLDLLLVRYRVHHRRTYYYGTTK